MDNKLVTRLQGLTNSPNKKSLLNGVKTVEKVDKLLLILLDSSGSMCERMGPLSKIKVAWEVFNEQLRPNLTDWTYGVIIFNNGAYWLIMPTTNTTALMETNSPKATGMTSMGKSLQMAWQWAGSYAKSARFILISDGEPSDLPKEQIIENATLRSSIPIDTIGVGSDFSQNYDPEFLRTLSRITGGVYTSADNAQTLSSTIKMLSPAQRPLLGLTGGR